MSCDIQWVVGPWENLPPEAWRCVKPHLLKGWIPAQATIIPIALTPNLREPQALRALEF